MFLDLEDKRIQIKDSTKLNRDGSVLVAGDINLGVHKIVNLSDLTSTMDAANKKYVDQQFATVLPLSSCAGLDTCRIIFIKRLCRTSLKEI